MLLLLLLLMLCREDAGRGPTLNPKHKPLTPNPKPCTSRAARTVGEHPRSERGACVAGAHEERGAGGARGGTGEPAVEVGSYP